MEPSDRGFDDGLSETRCAHCQTVVPTSEIVQICTVCDDELSEEHAFLGIGRDEYLHGGKPWNGGAK